MGLRAFGFCAFGSSDMFYSFAGFRVLGFWGLGLRGSWGWRALGADRMGMFDAIHWFRASSWSMGSMGIFWYNQVEFEGLRKWGTPPPPPPPQIVGSPSSKDPNYVPLKFRNTHFGAIK